jgi:hypothetical protein
MRARLGFLVFLLAGCGADGLEPVADDPGTGTQSLKVQAEIAAKPNLFDARTSSDFQTAMTVQLTDAANHAVTTGTVTVTSVTGKVALTYRDGAWRATAPTYDEIYTLDVTSGLHRLEDVRLVGPDIHVITAPMQNAMIDARQELTLIWERKRAADHTALVVNPEYPAKVPDTGTCQVTPYVLSADQKRVQQNTIRLIRTNTIEPAGAIEGSQLDVQIDNEVDVEAAPTRA